MDCPPIPPVHIDVVSGYYSQVAGALAGLSFAALVLLLGSENGKSITRRHPHALMALFVTLFTLVAAMISYSILAGDRPLAGRPAAEQLVAGLIFALAIWMLFYALQLLLEDNPEYKVIAKTSRWAVVVIIPVFGLMFLVLGTGDTEYLRSLPAGPGLPRACDISPSVPIVGWTLVGVMAVFLAFINIKKWPTSWASERMMLVPIAVMITAVCGLVAFGVLNTAPQNFIAPQWAVIAYLSTAAVFLTIGAVIIRLSSSSPVPSSSPLENQSPLPQYRFLGVITRKQIVGLIAVKRNSR